MIERFRTWLHRDCRRARGTADALLEVGARLGELGRYCHELTRAVVERPELVTVIAFGQGDEMRGVERVQSDAWFVVDSKKLEVKPGGSQTIDLNSNFPIRAFQVVVMANLDRVDIRGVFQSTNLLAMASPIAYGKDWQLGSLVRVVVQLREAGG
jgi:hypothetical protein